MSVKLEVILEEIRDRQIDVLMLQETWHDTDDVVIRRLRAEGYSIIEHTRPCSRQAETSLGVNHGGAAIIAASGFRLSSVNIGIQLSLLQFV